MHKCALIIIIMFLNYLWLFTNIIKGSREGPSRLYKALKKNTSPSLCHGGLHPSARDSLISHIPPHHFLPVCTVSTSSHSVATFDLQYREAYALCQSSSHEDSGDARVERNCKVQSTLQLISRMHEDASGFFFFFLWWWILTSEARPFSGEWPFTPAHLWVLLLYTILKYFPAFKKNKTKKQQKNVEYVRNLNIWMDSFNPAMSKQITQKYSAAFLVWLVLSSFNLKTNDLHLNKNTLLVFLPLLVGI